MEQKDLFIFPISLFKKKALKLNIRECAPQIFVVPCLSDITKFFLASVELLASYDYL